MNRSWHMSRGTRRIARALVEAIGPQWDDRREVYVDEALSKLERNLRRFPRRARWALVALYHFLQWAWLVTWDRVRPLTALTPAERCHRLEILAGRRGKWGALIYQAVRVPIVLAIYDCAAVDERLGIPRRAWRQDRIALRKRLLEADARRAFAPPLPEPLGSEGVVAPDRYLALGAGRAPDPRGERREVANEGRRP